MVGSKQGRVSAYFKQKHAKKIRRIAIRGFIFYPTIIYLIWSFLVFPIKMHGDAMLPNIANGEWVFFSRQSYGLKLPLADNLDNEDDVASEITRGDIVAILKPGIEKPSLWARLFDLPVFFLTFGFIKLVDEKMIIRRVLGLPGEYVTIKRKNIFIDNQPYGFKWPIKKQDDRFFDFEELVRDELGALYIPGGYVYVINDNWDVISDSRLFSLVHVSTIRGKIINQR